jgi:lipooligosaccharide transport system permease protein
VAGSFFPIEDLPHGFQIAANFNPLYQLVELVRGTAFGFEAIDVARFAGICVLAFLFWRLAVRQMEKRLID